MLTGVARRPIAHTCSSLEVPAAYESYPEFVKEFQLVLSEVHSCLKSCSDMFNFVIGISTHYNNIHNYYTCTSIQNIVQFNNDLCTVGPIVFVFTQS